MMTFNKGNINCECAWCKVNTDIRPRYTTDNIENGKCPICHSYNDIGQKTIELNSMRQIYLGALSLMRQMISKFESILDYADIDKETLQDYLGFEEESLEINFYTSEIVKELFLSYTHNSGGTSTGNLKNLLCIKEDEIGFELFEGESEVK